MTNVKITDLANYTDATATDVLPIVDVAADVTKRISIGNLVKAVPVGTAAAPAIAFDGNETTGVYSPGSNQIAFSTAGVGRLFIDSSGRLGIGTTNPDRTLTVNGRVYATGRGTSFGYELPDWRIYNSSTGNALVFDNYITEAFRVDSSNRLLVGTTTGTSRLSIAGTADNANSEIQITATGVASGYIGANSNGLNIGTDTAGLVFKTGVTGGGSVGASGTERMRIDSSGRVGIGTATPGNTLHLSGTNGVGTRVENTSNSISAYSTLESSGALQANISGAGVFTWVTGGGEKVRIDSSGRLGIGTSSPVQILHVKAGTDANLIVDNFGGGGGDLRISAINDAANANKNFQIQGDQLFFVAGGAERARLDTSGRLLVGTSSARTIEPYGLGSDGQIAHTYESVGDTAPGPGIALGSSSTTARFGPYLYLFRSRGGSVGSNTSVSSGDNLGTISFAGADGTDVRTRGAAIYAEVDGTPGANDMPGRIVLSTTADGASSPTERMRLDNKGSLSLWNPSNTTAGPQDVDGRIFAYSDGSNSNLYVDSRRSDAFVHINQSFGDTANRGAVAFYRNESQIGSISISSAQVFYNTTSDHRLKENVVDLEGATELVKQLQPRQFNFISEPDKVVKGFIAHEVQAIAPEAVTGEKDAEDENGNPKYQGIDQSKLVPLLTAALQEAVAKIESLEARLTAAGI